MTTPAELHQQYLDAETDRLTHLASTIEATQRKAQAINQLRQLGLTWGDIGGMVGLTAQRVQALAKTTRK